MQDLVFTYLRNLKNRFTILDLKGTLNLKLIPFKNKL